jgi:uncharacterized FlgJ-related protein
MLNTLAKYLFKWEIWGVLSGIVLILFLVLRKRTISKKDLIYKTARANSVPDRIAKYIVCQAAHETATAGAPFTSGLAVGSNNYFGMKKPGRGNQIGYKSNGYCIYAKPEDSVKDMIAWYYAKGGLLNWITSVEQYAQFLKSNNYFEDTLENYTTGLKYWYKYFYE